VNWDYDAFQLRHARAAKRIARCRGGVNAGGAGPDKVDLVVSRGDVGAMLRREGYHEREDMNDDDSTTAQGRQGRSWIVIYSPDKLCPACPELFNLTGLQAGGRGGWQADLAQVRAGLPRDQFFFLLGR
jgi:hypothetical protein